MSEDAEHYEVETKMNRWVFECLSSPNGMPTWLKWAARLSGVDCSKRAEPPMPSMPYTEDIPRIRGLTNTTTAVLAWSLPSGYQDQPTMQMASSLLTNYIYQNIVPSWEYGKDDGSVSGIGCF